VETGKLDWEMKEQEKTHAGGAEKSYKVDGVVSFPARKYRLRYRF
jgi:hypothetical protein